MLQRFDPLIPFHNQLVGNDVKATCAMESYGSSHGEYISYNLKLNTTEKAQDEISEDFLYQVFACTSESKILTSLTLDWYRSKESENFGT